MASQINVDVLREQVKQPGCIPSGLPSECCVGTMHAQIAGILHLVAHQKLSASASTLVSAVVQLQRGFDGDRLTAAAIYLREAIALLAPERATEYWDLCDGIASPVPARR